MPVRDSAPSSVADLGITPPAPNLTHPYTNPLVWDRFGGNPACTESLPIHALIPSSGTDLGTTPPAPNRCPSVHYTKNLGLRNHCFKKRDSEGGNFLILGLRNARLLSRSLAKWWGSSKQHNVQRERVLAGSACEGLERVLGGLSRVGTQGSHPPTNHHPTPPPPIPTTTHHHTQTHHHHPPNPQCGCVGGRRAGGWLSGGVWAVSEVKRVASGEQLCNSFCKWPER